MRITLNTGEIYEGKNEIEILEKMKSKTMFTEEKSIGCYIDSLIESLRIFKGKVLSVNGSNDEERAISLFLKLEKHNIITTDKEAIDTIFVYGTLMKGFHNYQRYCNDVSNIYDAETQGQLFHLKQGYPAVIKNKNGIVHGQAMTFPNIEETLKQMDFLESYYPDDQANSQYIRIVTQIRLQGSDKETLAYMYVFPEDRLGKLIIEAELVENGDWKKFINEKNRKT